MNKLIRGIIFVTFFAMVFPSVVLAVDGPSIPSPEQIITDKEMTNSTDLSRAEVHAFLKGWFLGTYKTPDINGKPAWAADIIFDAAQTFKLNPKVLLVTLQKEQALVETKTATQRQLDWALGFGVCDSCSKSDPRIQKYKGFGKQVYFAAQHFREAYLDRIATMGATSSGYGPGIEAIIDGTALLPENNATAALYTYTPHMHGNVVFMNIWNRWFTKQFPTGTLIQSTKTGAVWLVQNEKKRPVISRAALYARFNPKDIVPTSERVIASYPDGAPIGFPNYSLLRSPAGGIYLIRDEIMHPFVSMQALRDAGFGADDYVQVDWRDLSIYTEGDPILAKTS